MGPVFTISSWVLTTIVLFVTLNRGLANAALYMKVGDTVVLSSGSEASSITSLAWSHNSNLVAEWFRGRIQLYREFRDRCELNITTGELIISNLTLKDSGRYTPEINDKVLDKTEIKVISGVLKPTVSQTFDAEKTHCVFTCEGITTDCEPVNYTWRSGYVKKSETKDLNITKEETEPSFICELKNPVSSERSTEVLNPFTSSFFNADSDSNSLNWLILVLVLVLLLVAVGVIVGGVFIYKHRAGSLRLLSTQSPNVAADTPQGPLINDIGTLTSNCKKLNLNMEKEANKSNAEVF